MITPACGIDIVLVTVSLPSLALPASPLGETGDGTAGGSAAYCE